MLADYDAEGVAAVMGLAADMPPAKPGVAEERQRLFSSAGHDVSSPSVLPETIEQAVTNGLPRHVLRRVAAKIAGSDAGQVAALEWSVVPKSTLERRHERLSPAESERTERVARLFTHARRALGSEDEARGFMLAPHPELDGRTPVEAARTDLATRRAERILVALEYGLAI